MRYHDDSKHKVWRPVGEADFVKRRFKGAAFGVKYVEIKCVSASRIGKWRSGRKRQETGSFGK
jgi:hypothetical protein